MRHDLLADAFALMKNAESIGKKECNVPASKLIKGVLEVISKNGYVGGFDYIEDGRGGIFRVRLIGRINDCNVIRPRFSIRSRDTIRWEKRYLPSDRVGILVITTSKGVTDHREAGKARNGGKLLGYVY
jgi:small subunit ribosomal protein S8